MTNEEAIERLKEGEPFSEIYNKDWEETKYLAIKALEKQIPKRVKPLYENDDFNYSFSRCPVCNKSIRYGKYCMFCGQAISWSKDNADNS